MIPPTPAEPPDQVPAPIQATLAEPLASASGKAGPDEQLIGEIEEDRRSTTSGTRVNASVESLSDKGEGIEAKGEKGQRETKEKVVLDSHHKNGLQDQSAYL